MQGSQKHVDDHCRPSLSFRNRRQAPARPGTRVQGPQKRTTQASRYPLQTEARGRAGTGFLTDKLPIFLENASFAYGEGKQPLLPKVNLAVKQGDMVDFQVAKNEFQ